MYIYIYIYIYVGIQFSRARQVLLTLSPSLYLGRSRCRPRGQAGGLPSSPSSIERGTSWRSPWSSPCGSSGAGVQLALAAAIVSSHHIAPRGPRVLGGPGAAAVPSPSVYRKPWGHPLYIGGPVGGGHLLYLRSSRRGGCPLSLYISEAPVDIHYV